MNEENQRQEIGNSLRTITRVFEGCNANYRVLGSVSLVAHTKKIFRHINDVDVLLDLRSQRCVFQKLKEEGFALEKRSQAGFSWFEARKNGHLGLTFLLIGEFKESYFSWHFMKFLELRIRARYLQATEYSFEGATFIGIPIASAIAGIRQSFFNPKRKLDKQVLSEEIANTDVKVYNNISVHLAGMKLPYLYDIFSFLYNIYGGIRVKFGRKYEIWD